ncbi:hypothetical protein EOM09_04445 [bacterium]|nr:hypothetical protein [bacterium]
MSFNPPTFDFKSIIILWAVFFPIPFISSKNFTSAFDIAFIIENWFIISVLVFLSILANLIVNFSILKILGLNIKESIYGASLLSQLGEFSFIIAALGFSAGTISTHGYNLVIAIISISLFLSPIIISFTKKIICTDKILTNPSNKKS